MRETKSESVKRLQKATNKFKEYLIDCICWDGYDTPPIKTEGEKVKFLYNTFKSEYGWSITRYDSEYKAFQEWIMGLPSCFNIEFSNYEILKLAKRMGSLKEDATEKEEYKILANYWNYTTVKTFQLFKKFKVIE